MTGVNKIITDLVWYANTKDYFPTLVLEIPFSATAYINAYLRADSIDEAKLLPAIQPFFKSKESMRFIQTLKKWNYDHADKKITVACSDFEQGFVYSLQRVFDPYFKACGQDSLMPMVLKAQDVTPVIFAYMDSVISASSLNTSVAAFPFINNDYVKKVWANFQASYAAYHAMNQNGYNAFLKIRIQRIYKNLTDDFFFGKQLKEGKTLLWGGAEHANLYDIENCDTVKFEGWQLAYNYAPTKGKVFSIKIVDLAYNLPALYYTSDSYRRGTDGFVHLVDIYKKDVPTFCANSFRIIDDLTSLSQTLAVKSQENENMLYIFLKRI